MRHLLIATLVLLLSTLASQAADKAGEGQASPEEQYKSILADYQKAFEACQEALRVTVHRNFGELAQLYAMSFSSMRSWKPRRVAAVLRATPA